MNLKKWEEKRSLFFLFLSSKRQSFKGFLADFSHPSNSQKLRFYLDNPVFASTERQQGNLS